MTRYPFMTCANNFMKIYEQTVSDTTAFHAERKLRLIARKFLKLEIEGKITTSNPLHMKPTDIIEYVKARREDGVDDSTINKEISILNQMMTYLGNNAVKAFRAIGGQYKPKKYTGRKQPLTDEIIEKIYELARRTRDWEILEGCMAVILVVSTGIRTEEARVFDIDGIHLDGNRSYIYIEKVKGQGTYGIPRTSPIMDDVEDIFEKYLERRKLILPLYSRSKAMFPNFIYRSKDPYLSQQNFCKLKIPIENELGIKFEIRAGRRAFGQRAIDRGQNLTDISVVMGHTSTRTTERYYCRMKNDNALENMFRVKNGRSPDNEDLPWIPRLRLPE